MTECSCCGTPLTDINEPCPNCLPKMAWRPPTILGNPSLQNDPQQEEPKQYCCEADYHCRDLDPAEMRKAMVAMMILAKHICYGFDELELGKGVDECGEPLHTELVNRRVEYESGVRYVIDTQAVLEAARKLWPEMPELRLLDE